MVTDAVSKPEGKGYHDASVKHSGLRHGMQLDSGPPYWAGMAGHENGCERVGEWGSLLLLSSPSMHM